MQIKAVLFDLDGTLLPMNMDEFVKTYFTLLSKRMAEFGYDPKELTATIWAGTKAMMKNDGKVTNETVFWQAFADKYGDAYLTDQDKFDGGLDESEWAKICDGLDDEFPLKEIDKSQKKGVEDSLDGLSVSHAKSLIDKLSLCKLTPSERAGLKEVYDSLSSCKDKAILSEKLNYLVLLYARHCG